MPQNITQSEFEKKVMTELRQSYPDLEREINEWFKHKCNYEQMPRPSVSKAYGIPPLEDFISATLTQAHENGFKEGVAKSIEVTKETKRTPVKWDGSYTCTHYQDNCSCSPSEKECKRINHDIEIANTQTRLITSALSSLLTTPESKQGEPN